MERLLEPFQFAFMRDAMIAGAMVGAVCAVLSCYLVLKGWSLMGDAISHAVLPGLVIAHLAGVPLAAGAFVTGLLCAVASGFIKAHSRVKEDTAMGVVFTGLFAFGLVLFSKVKGKDLDIHHILFGNILGIEPRDFAEIFIVGGLTLAVVLALRRDLLLFCFDAAHARTIGLRSTLLYYVLLSLLAATVVTSLKAVGIILVVAMLVTPGSFGFLLADRFGPMLALATGGAVFSVLAGVYTSFFIDGSPAACIVLTQTGLFIVALVFAPKRGLLTRGRVSAA